MILILVAIVVAACIACALLHFSDGYDFRHMLSGVAGMALLIVCGVSSIVYVYAGWEWIATESKARIINREYGTHYTREEIFYASDVIDTIREIDRKRVEVNGDMLRDKPDAGATP